ncbi:unnamed protein product, partial [Musa acuminata var. zebrina]
MSTVAPLRQLPGLRSSRRRKNRIHRQATMLSNWLMLFPRRRYSLFLETPSSVNEGVCPDTVYE